MTRRRTNRAALTLIEVMLALVILVVLLTALGVCLQGALVSYRENEKIATTTQAARAVLDRMMREVRTSAAVEANASTITIVPPADGSGLQLVQYAYDPAGQRLLYRRTVWGTTDDYPIFGDEVKLGSFDLQTQTGLDWQGYTCIKGLRVTLGLRMDRHTFSVGSSSAPRRNQTY